MKTLHIFAASLLATVSSAALSAPAPAVAVAANPLLAKWAGPHGGVPAFDKVQVAQFKPALEAAMAENRREIEAIAINPAAPTFANTFVPLEKAGRTLNRVYAYYGIWSSNLSSPEFQKVEQEMSPKLAAFQDEIVQNDKLFRRIDTIYNSPEKAKLTPEQQRLVWVYWNNFTQQGAKLNAADKAALSQINQQLAGLYTKFSQNQLFDEEKDALVLDSQAQLAGLSPAQIAAAAADAERRGMKGKWTISNTRSAMEPFLTNATDRSLRQKAFEIWTSRGDHAGEHDNNPLVTQILQLRAKKAKLLGYPTYAHWHLSDTMAKTPENALNLMMAAWTPAIAQVKTDVAAMQAIVDQEGGHFKIQPWDYRFYAEKVRKAKYDLDMAEVKPYLQLDHVRDAMFWAAGQLYGFTFTPVTGLPVFNLDVTVYEVKGRDGQHVGLWYFDPYARPGKNSGAWMNEYRTQANFDGPITTIVSNNANFVKAQPGEPVTISFIDAETMFHEFGHALHGLNSAVLYPTLAGTSTARDFVEFPSQFNEHFLTTPQVMKFLVNAKGEPIPQPLVENIKAAQTFNQAFSVVEAQASAIIDMKMHLAGETPVDPKTFEKATLTELGLPSEIVMRHRIPQFGHVFSGEGYAAGYYGYLWAEVLDQDAYEAFAATGNPFDPATAKRFRDTILSVGNTVDPAIAYRNFRGRDPKVDAWLRDKGFPVAAAGTH
jgi:peptidyl-dipeptidase Dcp